MILIVKYTSQCRSTRRRWRIRRCWKPPNPKTSPPDRPILRTTLDTYKNSTLITIAHKRDTRLTRYTRKCKKQVTRIILYLVFTDSSKFSVDYIRKPHSPRTCTKRRLSVLNISYLYSILRCNIHFFLRRILDFFFIIHTNNSPRKKKPVHLEHVCVFKIVW